jgi:hypothetical protein
MPISEVVLFGAWKDVKTEKPVFITANILAISSQGCSACANIASNRIAIRTSTDDFETWKNSATWAGARDSSTGDGWYQATEANTVTVQYSGGTTYNVCRYLGFFDTTALAARLSATVIVQSAKLYLYGSWQNGSITLRIAKHTSSTTASSSSFGQVDESTVGSNAFSLTYGTLSGIDLNSTGLGWIDSGAVTKLAVIGDGDYTNTAPVGSNVNSAHQSGNDSLGRWPYLMIVLATVTSKNVSVKADIRVNNNTQSVSVCANIKGAPGVYVKANIGTPVSAIQLNGSSQYAYVPNWSDIDAMTDGTCTIETWFWNDPANVAYAPGHGFGNATVNCSYISTENGTGSEGVNFGWAYSGTNADGYKASGVFTQSTWVQVTEVFTLNGPTRIYVNGSEITGYGLQNTPSGTPDPVDGYNFYLGRDGSSSADRWKGRIGGFLRVWNTSRTQAEINANKNYMLDGSKESNLLINVNFAFGLTNDAVSGSHNLVTSGSPTWVAGPTGLVFAYKQGVSVCANIYVAGGSTSKNVSVKANISGSTIKDVSAKANIVKLFSSLSDNFDDNSIDTGIWTTSVQNSATVAETTGKIVITPANSTDESIGTLSTIASYSLISNYVQVQAVQVADTTNCYTDFELRADATNYVGIGIGAGNIEAYQSVGGSFSIRDQMTYDSNTHKYWRIRESNGWIYFDYSADAKTWVCFSRGANPITLSSLTAHLIVREHTLTATPGSGQFDNFNILTSADAIDTLSDNFDDGSIDSVKWTSYTEASGAIAETGGNIQYTLAANTDGSWAGIYSKKQYDFTGKSVWVEVKNAATGDSWLDLTLSIEQLPIVDNFFSIGIDCSGNNDHGGIPGVEAVLELGGQDTVLASLTYNSSVHKFLRMRESGGIIYWDWSTNGSDWTNWYSRSNPFPVTNLYVVLDDYEYSGSTAPGVHTFDNFNTFASTSKDVSAKANIVTTNTKGVSVKANIKVTNTKDLSSKANIRTTVTKDVSAKADILTTNTKDNSAKASIVTKNVTKDVSVKADIKSTLTKDISAKADILVSGNTKNLSARANIILNAEQLIDNFNDNSIDTGKWGIDLTGGGTVEETGGKIIVTPKPNTTQWQGLASNDWFNLVGSYFLVNLLQASNGTDVETEILNVSNEGSSDRLYLVISNGTIRWGSWGGGDLGSTSYNSDTQRWFRVRESGGTFYWDYSSNGSTWNNFGSVANPFSMKYVYVNFAVSEITSIPSPGASWWDNFNFIPTTQGISVRANIQGSAVATSKDQSAKANIVATTSQGASARANIIVKNGPYYEINLLPDPSFENATPMWSNVYQSGSGAGSHVNYWASEGSWQWIIQASLQNWWEWILKADGVILKAGHTYTISATVMTDIAGLTWYRVFRFDRVGGGGFDEMDVYIPNSYTYYRVSYTYTPTYDSYLYFNPLPDTTGLQAMWYDGVLLEDVTTSTTYFDGDYNGASWTGSQDASQSAYGGQRVWVKASIVVTNTDGVSAKADILATSTKDNSAKADILATLTKGISTKANIVVTTSKDASAKANIVVTNSKNESVKADILATSSKDESAKANIKATTTKDLSTKADILATYTDGLSAKASIVTKNVTKDESSKANIVVTNSKDQSVKADIKATYSKDVSAKADILATTSCGISVKASISIPVGKELWAKANILAASIKDSSVKSNILSTNSPRGRMNLIPNPSFEDATFFWGGYRDSTYSYVGTYAGMLNCAFTSGTRGAQTYLSPTSFVNLIGGTQYTYSAYVYIPVGSPITQIRISPRKSDWTGTQTALFSVTAGAWTRIYITFTPATTSDWRLIIADPEAPGFTGTAYWWVDAALIEPSGSLNSYFDGTYDGAQWAGTVNKSQSYLLNGLLYSKANIVNQNLAKDISVLANIVVSNTNGASAKANIVTTIPPKLAFSSGWEAGNITDGGLWDFTDDTGGLLSAVSSPIKFGGYALRVNDNSGTSGTACLGKSLPSWAGRKFLCEIYIYINSLPSSGAAQFIYFQDQSWSDLLFLQVSSTGNLNVSYKDAGNTTRSLGGTVSTLSTGQFYKIGLEYSWFDSHIQVYINDTPAYSSGNTNLSLKDVSWQKLRVGEVFSSGSITTDYILDAVSFWEWPTEMLVKANILATSSSDSSAKANIKATTSQDVSAKANIYTSPTKNVSVKASIVVSNSKDVYVKTNIVKTELKDVSVLANIMTTPSWGSSAKASIVTTVAKDVSAKANIVLVMSGNVAVKANIVVTNLEAVSAKASIVVTNTKNVFVKANIKGIKKIKVKANIVSGIVIPPKKLILFGNRMLLGYRVAGQIHIKL